MVHSVAGDNGTVYAAHNGKVYRINGEKSENVDLDLRQIGLVQRGNYLVGIAGDSKDVVVLDATTLEQKAKHTFPKRPSAWCISSDWLVVSDKFGDVFKAPLLSAQDQPETSEDGFGSAILGHVSMVLALAATQNRVFSSDRDEHIRISAFPQSYVIERFLLGHTAFVSHLVLDNEFLLSCGGDPYAIAWNWQTGAELGRLDLSTVKNTANTEIGVISAVICQSRVYLALEDSNQIVSADFPSFGKVEVTDNGEIVHALASDGSAVYVAGASSVHKLGETKRIEFDGESNYEIVSEKTLRKR